MKSIAMNSIVLVGTMIIFPLKLLQDFLNTNDTVDNLEIFINNFESLDNNYKLIREKLPKLSLIHI